MTNRNDDYDEPMPTSVYRIYGRAGELLYIGCATDVAHRIYMHGQNHATPMGDYIHHGYDRHESVEYPSRGEARAAERAAITAEGPWFNRHHNPLRWRRVQGRWFPVDEAGMEAVMQAARPTRVLT